MLWWFTHKARSNFLHYVLGLNPSRLSASKSCLAIPQTQHSTQHRSHFCCYLLDFKFGARKTHLGETYLSSCQVILATITKEIFSVQTAPPVRLPLITLSLSDLERMLLGTRLLFLPEYLIPNQWSKGIAPSSQVCVVILHSIADTCSLHKTQRYPVYGVIQRMAVTCSYKILSEFPWQRSQAIMTGAIEESLLLDLLVTHRWTVDG